MKTELSMQDLFDDLPVSLLEDCPIDVDDVSVQTVERIATRSVNRTRRRLSKRALILPLAAAFAAVATVGAYAFGVLLPHAFQPTRETPPPSVVVEEELVPMQQDYDGAVAVGDTITADNLQVTLDSFVFDDTQSTLQMLVAVETLDETPLTEWTLSAMSKRLGFRLVTLYRNGEPIPLVRDSARDPGTGEVYRVDDATVPHKATFEIIYQDITADILGQSPDVYGTIAGYNYTLELTDLVDEVAAFEDIGFAFDSMVSLNAAVTSATAEQMSVVGVYYEYANGTVAPARALADSGQRVGFSTVFGNAYIDNIAFSTDKIEGQNSQLLISFGGLDTDRLPVLIDRDSGKVYSSTCVHNRETAAAYGLVDGDRITLCYNGVTEDMLNRLFMVQRGGEGENVRAKGTWTVSFDVKETDAIHAEYFDVDWNLTFHEYRMHATSLVITDSSMYIEGTYTVDMLPVGAEQFGGIGSAGAILFGDGSELRPALRAEGTGDLRSDGTFRFGGSFTRFVNAEDVTGFELFGETVYFER